MTDSVDFSYIRRDKADVEADFKQQMPTISEGKYTATDEKDPGYALFKSLVWYNDKAAFLLDQTVGEAFLATAKTREGVVRGAKNLGYPIQQAQPATCQVQLTFPAFNDIVTIPAGSNWRINGISFSCPTAITIASGQTTKLITLQQGSYYRQSYTSQGQEFWRLSVSKNCANLVVTVDNVAWTLIDSFLDVEVPTSFKLYDEPNGTKTIEFGNDNTIYAPPSGAVVVVTGIITDGINGNVGQSGLTVRPLTAIIDSNSNTITNDFTGITLTSALDGQDEESTESIRSNAPRYYALGKPARASHEDDYETIVSRIPGITDTLVIGGEKVDRYGEVIITVYGPNPYVVTDDFLQSVYTKLKQLNVATITPVVRAPIIVELDLSMTLGLIDTSVPATTASKQAAEANLIALINGLGIGGKKSGGGLFAGQMDAVICKSPTSVPAISNIPYARYDFVLRSFATSSAGKITIPVLHIADYTHAVLKDNSNNVLFSGDATPYIANDQFVFDKVGLADQKCTLTYKDINGEMKLNGSGLGGQVIRLTSLTTTTERANLNA